MALSSRFIGRLKIRQEESLFVRRFLLPGRDYIRMEETAGWPLLLAAAAALAWAAVDYASYQEIWDAHISLNLYEKQLNYPVKEWITDILLPLFFFVIGVEIKEEIRYGQLNSFRRAILPIAAALGGMAAPAGIYLLLNHGGPYAGGWGVPVATDVAFAMGVVILLGSRVPRSLKVLILAYSATDDIGGTMIIAFVYSTHLAWAALAVALGIYLALVGMRYFGIIGQTLYILLGISFLFVILISGVHTTVGGFLLGLLVPLNTRYRPEEFENKMNQLMRHLQEVKPERTGLAAETATAREALQYKRDCIIGQIDELVRRTQSTGKQTVNLLYPWINYFVLPLFAVSHAGVPLTGSSLSAAMTSRVTWGVTAGLFVGKTVGIFLAVLAVWKFRLASLPAGLDARHVFGMGLLGGIGFTVAIFIAKLAFRDDQALSQAKIGILLTSVVAAVAAYLYFLFIGRKNQPQKGT